MKYKPGWSTKNTGQIENKKHEEQTQWHQEEERELKWDKKRVGKTQRQETNTWQMRINIPKQNRKQPNRRPNPWHACASEIKSFTDEKSALKACNFFIYIFANTAEYLFLKKKTIWLSVIGCAAAIWCWAGSEQRVYHTTQGHFIHC